MSAEQKQEAVVKPLEWVEVGGDEYLRAETPFAFSYSVYREYGRDGEAWANNVTDGAHATKEAAKAASQADYAARIRSALVAPAASSQERIAQLEALADEWEAEAKALPLGHEHIGRGKSSYNWYRYFIGKVRERAGRWPDHPDQLSPMTVGPEAYLEARPAAAPERIVGAAK